MTNQYCISDEAPSRSMPPLIMITAIAVVFFAVLMTASLIWNARERSAAEAALARVAQTVPTEEPSEEVQELFRPLDGATSVRRDPGAFGSYHVADTVAEPFPATAAILQMSSRLNALGWMALPDHWLNPGFSSSKVGGWSEFGEATGTRRRNVHEWRRQWQDASGNIVDYTFRYSYPAGGPQDLTVLTVNGSWYPKAATELMYRSGTGEE